MEEEIVVEKLKSTQPEIVLLTEAVQWMGAGEAGLKRLPPAPAPLPVGRGYRCTRNREAAIDPLRNMAGKTAGV